MDLKQLEYFVRVAELGSFTRAAQVLGVAQPALSRQVRLLEVELRQNLLVRNGRGATPTEAGQLLLEHGRGILEGHAMLPEIGRRLGGTRLGQRRDAAGQFLDSPGQRRDLLVGRNTESRQSALDASLEYDAGANRARQFDVAARYSPQPGRVLNAAYRFTRDAVKQEQLKMGWPADSYPTVPFLEKLQNG